MLTGAEMQLGRGESIADTARVLSRYVDAIMIRILDHEAMRELARHSDGSGHQRPHQAVPSLPGDGRHPHLRGASRPDPRAQDRLERRLQQRPVVLDRRRGAVRLRARHRLPAAFAAASRADRRGPRARGRGDSGRRSLRRRRGRGGGDFRLLGLDGRRGRGPSPQSARALSGERRADARGRSRRDLHALPARPSRRGSDRRSDRRPAIGGLRRGGEPAARAEGDSRLVPRGRRHDAPLARAASAEAATTWCCRSRRCA